MASPSDYWSETQKVWLSVFSKFESAENFEDLKNMHGAQCKITNFEISTLEGHKCSRRMFHADAVHYFIHLDKN